MDTIKDFKSLVLFNLSTSWSKSGTGGSTSVTVKQYKVDNSSINDKTVCCLIMISYYSTIENTNFYQEFGIRTCSLDGQVNNEYGSTGNLRKPLL